MLETIGRDMMNYHFKLAELICVDYIINTKVVAA